MKKSSNYIKLEFLSRSTNEGFARSAVAAFASQLDPTLDELGDIKTAVSEAVTNAIVHAYPDTLGKIVVRVRLLDGGVLEIAVYDWDAVLRTWRKPASRSLRPEARSAAAWASPSWRASWIRSRSAPARARGPS